MRDTLASQEVFDNLFKGKYSHWAENLDEATLEALLAAVGEFGIRFSRKKETDGRSPNPTFQLRGVAKNRITQALEELAIARVMGRLDAGMGSGWQLHFSPSAPALSHGYSNRLSHSPSTAWAATLDERSLALIIWRVGECGIRIKTDSPPQGFLGPPLTFDSHDSAAQVMGAALSIIVSVQSGTFFSLDMVSDIISAAEITSGQERQANGRQVQP